MLKDENGDDSGSQEPSWNTQVGLRLILELSINSKSVNKQPRYEQFL